MALRSSGRFGANCMQKSLPQLKLHRLARGEWSPARGRTARFGARAQGDIDVNTVPDLGKATAIAATDHTKAVAAPRIRFSRRGFFIDHPDPEHGDQLMSDALG